MNFNLLQWEIYSGIICQPEENQGFQVVGGIILIYRPKEKAQGKILDSAIRLPALPSFYPKLNLDPKKENLARKANHNTSVSKGAKYIIFVFNQWYQNTSVHMIYIYDVLWGTIVKHVSTSEWILWKIRITSAKNQGAKTKSLTLVRVHSTRLAPTTWCMAQANIVAKKEGSEWDSGFHFICIIIPGMVKAAICTPGLTMLTCHHGFSHRSRGPTSEAVGWYLPKGFHILIVGETWPWPYIHKNSDVEPKIIESWFFSSPTMKRFCKPKQRKTPFLIPFQSRSRQDYRWLVLCTYWSQKFDTCLRFCWASFVISVPRKSTVILDTNMT